MTVHHLYKVSYTYGCKLAPAQSDKLGPAGEVNTRGIKQANKYIMMATLTYNLKKYIKFIIENPKPT
ncbi:MAG: hypothetical protein ACKVQB_09610 [Bacteroidia bacterium]